MTVAHDPTSGPDETLEGLLRAVEAEFGARLDEAGRENVRRQLTRMLATVVFSQASQLRKLDLAYTGIICQTVGLTYGETTYIFYRNYSGH